MKRRRRNSAFTVIELIVVIGIVLVLAAILVPVFARAKRSAKEARSISAMRQIHVAATLYQVDHGESAHNFGLPENIDGRLAFEKLNTWKLMFEGCDFTTPLAPKRTVIWWNVNSLSEPAYSEDKREHPDSAPMVLDLTCDDYDIPDFYALAPRKSVAVSMTGNLIRNRNYGDAKHSKFYRGGTP